MQSQNLNESKNPKVYPTEKHINNIDPQLWYEKYYQSLYSYGLRKLSDKDALEDIIQETFLIAFEGIDSFNNRSSEKTWLTGILKKRIFLHFRNQDIKRRFELEFSAKSLRDETLYEKQVVFNGMLTKYKTNDLFAFSSQIIGYALSKLSPLNRSVLLQRYFYGKSVPEVCANLGITESRCWIICHRTKAKLNNCMLKQFRNQL